MAYAQNRFNKVTPRQHVRETWEERSALFGLIKWMVVVKKESIGEDLAIYVDRIPEKVLLNGTRYVPVERKRAQ